MVLTFEEKYTVLKCEVKNRNFYKNKIKTITKLNEYTKNVLFFIKNWSV